MTLTWKIDLEALAKGAEGYTSDPLKASPSTIFVALESYDFNGHDRLEEVLQKRPFGLVLEEGRCLDSGVLALRVPSSLEAHRCLAAHFRRRYSGTVIAVGGSNGKTTTKDLVHGLLEGSGRPVLKTEASRNGHRGVPITLENLNHHYESAVIEIGIDGPGEMASHFELVSPEVSVLTSIGEEHLRQLDSIERVFEEERVLCDRTVARGGTCFVPADDPWLRTLIGIPGVIGVDRLESEFESVIRERIRQPHLRQNARLAVAVARHLGRSDQEVLERLRGIDLPEGRGKIHSWGERGLLIEDHYNSNPASLRASIASAAELSRERGLPLFLALGDMMDLGVHSELQHRSIAGAIRDAAPAKVLLIGAEMGRIRTELSGISVSAFDDVAGALVSGSPFPEQDSVILVKGSRGIRLENWIQSFKRAFSGKKALSGKE